MDAKYERKNDRKKIKNISFGTVLARVLGRFGGYKNKIEKKLQKRRQGTPGIDIYSWGQRI